MNIDEQKVTESYSAPVQNPLLEKVKLPGKIFKIPSGGYLYNNGELDSSTKDGEVHVRPLSALAEIKIKNPDLLFSGKAIEEVFRECIPEIKKPMELFGRDVDALMCFLRVVTYGPTYRVDARHNCANGKDQTYDIDLNEVIAEIKELDPTQVGKKYSVTMPNDQVVELEPTRFKHVIDLLQTEDLDHTPTSEDVQKNLIDSLINLINNVDGISSREHVEEWLRAIPTTFISRIADAMETSNDWGPSFIRKVKCKDCGEEFELELPVNPINFFTE